MSADARRGTSPSPLRDAPAEGRLRAAVQRRTLAGVVISQALGGAGLAAGVAVGALLAQQMLGSDALAGIPTALFTLGSALAAFLVGRFTQRWGRRNGLALGFLAGGVGAAAVVVAAVAEHPVLLFAALFVYGAGTATNLQARYAGTDLAPRTRRATAVSVAMMATTLGAVAGPNLVEPLGQMARGLGLPELTGPFLLAAAAYSAAGLVLFALLRPDPFLLARELDAQEEGHDAGPAEAPSGKPMPGAYVGAAIMVLTQIAMVAIMTMTPVHMRAHHHDLSAIGLVISLHIAAMWLPALVTGVLVDAWGRIPMAATAAATLLAAGVVAATAPGHSMPLLILALVLLGLGWNIGLISGTALIVDGTGPQNRPRVQGTVDVLIALPGAGGGVMSGMVVQHSGFSVLSMAGGLLAILLLPVLWWAHRRPADGA